MKRLPSLEQISLSHGKSSLQRENDSPLSASPMQAAMLRPLLMGQKRPPYVQQLLWTLPRGACVTTLNQAIRHVVRRHDVFRMEFLPSGGEFRVRDTGRVRVSFKTIDLSSDPARFASLREEDFRKGFSSPSSPLCRFTFFILPKSESRLLWTSHHALFDGRGRLIVLEEIQAAYQALRASARLDSDPPPPSYVRHLQWLARQNLTSSRAFWSKAFEGVSEPNPLPLQDSSKGKPDDCDAHGVVRLSLPAYLSQKIESLQKRHGLSPNLLLQAAWSLVLSRTTHLPYAVFGAVRACRYSSLPEAPDSVGLYVNTVPVVLRPDPSLTPLQLMDRARRLWSELRSHENSPHASILQTAGLPADQPLFQTLVGYEKYQLTEYISLLGGPLADSRFELRGFTEIPLAIQLFRGERFLIEGVYRKDCLAGESAQRLIGYLHKALSHMARHPDWPLHRIQLLDAADRRAIRKNGRMPKESNVRPDVVAAFEAIAGSCPDAIALAWEGGEMDYRALNDSANRLARWLRRRGVKRGDRVGILVGRDHWGPLSCLAILKCGAVYVPFDPEYPKERLRWMARDADIRFGLLGPGIGCPASLPKAKLVDLVEAWPAIHRCSSANLSLALSPDQPAYLMYTSGSTGKPKGVLIPHRGITRLVLRPDYVSLNARARTLQLAPVSFDAATFEIWGALLNGGMCAIYPERVPTLEGLEAALRQYRVNTLWLTASLFNFIVSAKPQMLGGVRQILTGGEALSPSHVRRAQQALPDCSFINGYGPTENTTFSCCYPIPRLQPKDKPVPIGRAIGGSTAHVLDLHLQACPVGVAGELYVGGLGVGLGYHRRPELTRQRFIENPFGPGLLYRTGDRARLRGDGVIEFLGRLDSQIKIRGHRIEPDEIRAQVLTCDEIDKCEVLARDSGRGEKELVAFIVFRSAANQGIDSIRNRLSRRLPSYMVPRRLQAVRSIPVTRNGKADHQALLARLDDGNCSPARVDRRSLTPTQAKLLDLWTGALRSEPSSLETSFFACGGNSLLGAQLALSIERAFGISFALCQLDELDTLLAQASWLDQRSRRKGAEPRPFQITSSPKRKYNEIRWKWAESLAVERRPRFAGCMLIPRAFTLNGHLDVPAFREALQSLVHGHDALRSRIVVHRGKERLLVADEVEVQIDEQDFSALGPEKALARARRVFETDCVSKVSLTSYPLYRIRLVKLDRDKHFFIFLLHHGIGDARSLEIAFRHVAAVYNGATGATSAGPDLPAFSFLDYQDSFLRWYDQGKKEIDAAFWERTLAGSKPHRLPMEEDFPIAGHSPATIYHRVLNPDWAEAMKRFCADRQASPFAFLATVWQILLRRYTGEAETPISLPPDIRMTPESANIMGNFGNLIFIKPHFSASDSFADALSSTRQALLRSLDHKCYPLSEIRKIWIPEDDARLDPLKQTMVTEADTPDALALNGIDAEPADREKYSSISKLNLFIRLSKKRPTLAFSAPNRVLRPEGMERLIYNFQDFVQRAMIQPDLPCSDFPELRSAENARAPLTQAEREASILQPTGQAPSSNGSSKAKLVSTPSPKPSKFNSTEMRIASIWQSILGHTPRSIDASFFDLGGSSLSAARLTHALKEAYGVTLEIAQIDANPTLRRQASLVDQQSPPPTRRRASSFHITPQPSLQLRPVRWRWKHYMWLESLDNPIYQQIARAFILQGPLHRNRLQQGLQSLVDSQVQLRSRIVENKGKPSIQTLADHPVELDFRDFSNLAEEEASARALRLFEQDSASQLAVSSFPLYRFRLLRINPKKHLFTFLVHHGIADARSLEISFRHLSRIYNGAPAPQPPPNYFDYETSYLKWFNDRRQREAKRYWSGLLKGAPVAPLSIENELPMTKSCQAAIHTRPLQPAWASRILDFCQQHRFSDFVFLVTLLRTLLARYGAPLSMPVSFSTDVRLSEEANQIIGHFGNVILLRHEIDPDASLHSLMAATKEALHRSLEHKALEYLDIKRCSENQTYTDDRFRPSSQAMVIKADTSTALQLQGVTIQPIHRHLHTTFKKVNLFIRLEDRFPSLAFSSPVGLFDPSGYQRLMHHFQDLIQCAIASPSAPFRELPDYRDRQAACRPLSASEKRSSIFADA